MTGVEKHTPGPWAVCQSQGADPFTVFSQREGAVGNKWICQGPNVGALVLPAAEEIEANARLIAAAPTMHDYIAARAATGDSTAIQIMEVINANS